MDAPVDSLLSAKEVDLLNDSVCNQTAVVLIKDGCLDEDLAERMLQDAASLRALLTPAGMSRGDSKWTSSTHRSDSTCWVTPDLCKERGLDGLSAFVKQMVRECKPLKSHLGISGQDFSVQLAVYPANSNGYVRHLDAFTSSNSNDDKKCARKLTCLLYLNKAWQGGQLRVFKGANKALVVARSNSSSSSNEGQQRVEDVVVEVEEEHVDIDPMFNRLVVFRSDVLEHQVLPSSSLTTTTTTTTEAGEAPTTSTSAACERLAITFWASGPPSSSSSVGGGGATVAPNASSSIFSPNAPHANSSSSSSSSSKAKRFPLPVDAATAAPSSSSSSSSSSSFTSSFSSSSAFSSAAGPTIFVGIACYRDSECQHTIAGS